jgi:hypothetical protein
MEFISFNNFNFPSNYLSTFVDDMININPDTFIINVTDLINSNVIYELNNYLIQKGYDINNINQGKYYSEIHNQNNKNSKNKFPWHVDSNGAIEGDVVTFIYYHHFTPNTKGGNLMIKDYEKCKWWFFEYKTYTQKTIDIWSEEHKNRFVFMEENLEHKAEEVYSTEPFNRQFLTIFINV